MERALRKLLPSGKFANVDAVRSRMMGAIRGTNNKSTERRLRFALVGKGVSGWTLRPKGLAGTPDFVFLGSRVAVFVDGCFWHGCPECRRRPRANSAYWTAKIDRNITRDVANTHRLEADGFTVLRFWEHELKRSLADCVAAIRERV